ncbi:MAG: hypothetical protein ACLTY5_08915 [Angelakisella sp.]
MGYEDDGAKDFSDPKTPEKVFIHTDQIKLLNCCLKELPQRKLICCTIFTLWSFPERKLPG